MMPIVAKLIGISVFGSIVLVAAALTGLLAVFTLLDQIGDLDQRYTVLGRIAVCWFKRAAVVLRDLALRHFDWRID